MATDDPNLPFSCKLCQTPITADHQLFSIDRAPLSAQLLPTASQFDRGNTAKPLCLYRCGSCGHYQLSSEPVSYWREVITAAGLSVAMRTFRSSQLAEWVEKYDLRGKSIIEVGCGAGYLLDILTSLGVNATGIEFGSDMVNLGLQHGRNIRQGYILDVYTELQARYDGFICINFLEHAPEPVAFLRAVRACCKPGAVGIIEVPNFDRDIIEAKSHNVIRDHLSYFTEQTLQLICFLCGFELLSISECWHGNDLEAKVRVPIQSAISEWQQGTPTIQAVSELLREETKRIAVWGASHQALTLLAILNPKNVICIADSASFKQGKVDPVCGIPIVAPSEMIAQQPDLIIIMAAGYSREVQKILKTEYNYQGRALILDEYINTIFPQP